MGLFQNSIDRNDRGHVVYEGMRTTCMSVSPRPRLIVRRSKSQGTCYTYMRDRHVKHRGSPLYSRRDLIGVDEQTGDVYCRHCLLGLSKHQLIQALHNQWDGVLGEPDSAIRFDEIWNHRASEKP